MNNEMVISNSKKNVKTGIQLNDKDYLNCLLSNLKEMEKGYVRAMIEASNERLFENYRSTFLAISDLQRKVYELMFENGWYMIEKVPITKINNKYNMLSSEYDDLELDV